MTPKQKKLLDFIKGYIKKNEISPSYQEMADFMETSKSQISDWVDELWSQGELTYRPGKARSIRIKCPLEFLKAKGLYEEYMRA